MSRKKKKAPLEVLSPRSFLFWDVRRGRSLPRRLRLKLAKKACRWGGTLREVIQLRRAVARLREGWEDYFGPEADPEEITDPERLLAAAKKAP